MENGTTIEAVHASDLSIAVDEDGDIVILLAHEPTAGEDVRDAKMAYSMSPLQTIEVARGLLDSAIAANGMQKKGNPMNILKRLVMRMKQDEEETAPDVAPREPDDRANPWDKPE